MNILALDPATRCGVAEGSPGGNPTLQTINFGRTLDAPEDVFARAGTWIARRLEQPGGRPDAIAIETAFDNATVQGLYAIFAGAARARGIRLYCVAPTTWRAYSLGNGRLSRPKAKAAAVETCKRLGWPAIDDNAAEAGLIWLWCCSMIDPRRARRPEPLFLGRS